MIVIVSFLLTIVSAIAFMACVTLSRRSKQVSVLESENKTMLRKLNALFMESAQCVQQLSSLKLPADWTPENNDNLRKFLLSPTGQSLMNRWEQMAAAAAEKHARDTFHTQHSAGITQGIYDAKRWVESLASEYMQKAISRSTGDQVENDTTNSDGEAALVEKYSP